MTATGAELRSAWTLRLRSGQAREGARPHTSKNKSHTSKNKNLFQLLQLCVLGFGFFQDGKVGIGIFPQGKKILIRGSCF